MRMLNACSGVALFVLAIAAVAATELNVTTTGPSSPEGLSRLDTQADEIKRMKAELASLKGTVVPYVVPSGTIIAFAGPVPPDGWLMCDGATLDRAKYGNLAQVIGAFYGEREGNPRLPDLRGRLPLGSGEGPALTARAFGVPGGFESHRLSIAEMPGHDHQFNDPGHRHDNDGPGADRRGFISFAGAPHPAPRISGGLSVFPRGQHSGISEREITRNGTDIQFKAQGGDQPFSLMPPFLGISYIIKT